MGQRSGSEGVCCGGRQAAEGKDGTLTQNKAPGEDASSPPGMSFSWDEMRLPTTKAHR
jgi:hypothetical protein